MAETANLAEQFSMPNENSLTSHKRKHSVDEEQKQYSSENTQCISVDVKMKQKENCTCDDDTFKIELYCNHVLMNLSHETESKIKEMIDCACADSLSEQKSNGEASCDYSPVESETEDAVDSSEESESEPEELKLNSYYPLDKFGEEIIERINSSEEYIEAMKTLKAEMEEKRKNGSNNNNYLRSGMPMQQDDLQMS